MFKDNPIKIKNLAEYLGEYPDILICSASFEERCKSVVKHIPKKAIKKALVCCNQDQLDLVGEFYEEIIAVYEKKATTVWFEMNNPLKIADNLLYELDKIKGPKKYLVDVTTFTHEALLIVLNVLRNKLDSATDQVKFIYTASKNYSSNELSIPDKWLTKGIGSIRSILGFSGEFIPSRKIHLVILMGYETERAIKLIESYEPSIVSLGIGDTSIGKENYEVNEDKYKSILKSYPSISPFSFSCVDPVQTKAALEREINKYPNHNVVVAALNTKISTLGVALFAFEKPEVQLCYATANSYNIVGYSSPSDNCYVFALQDFFLKHNVDSSLKALAVD